jgi:hypothetical protein
MKYAQELMLQNDNNNQNHNKFIGLITEKRFHDSKYKSMIDSKYLVDFSNEGEKAFDSSVQELRKILESIFQPDNIGPESFTSDQVREWLHNSGISSTIIDALFTVEIGSEKFNNFDGKCLKQIHRLKKETPEFFGHLFISKSMIHKQDLNLFSQKLDSLFQ